MRYDYLSIIKTAGFRIPKKEYSFDEDTYSQIIDKREQELTSIIMSAFYNLRYYSKVNDNTLIFENHDKKKYYVYITSNEIVATFEKINDKNLMEQREFIIKIDEEGNIIFKQLIVSKNKTIILKTFIVDKPNYYESCTAYIEGYDETTFDLFKKSISSDDKKESYINHFINFLNASQILPDISRKIVNLSYNSYKQTISEYDMLIGHTNTPIKTVPVNSNPPTVHLLLESYIRARDFSSIITMSKGLSSSFQKELSLTLMLHPAIYSYLNQLNTYK